MKKLLALLLIGLLIGCASNITLPDTVLSDYQYTYDGDVDPVVFLNTWICDRESYQYKEGYYLFLFENPEDGEIRRIEAIFITDGNYMHLVGYKYTKDNFIHLFVLNPETNHFEHVDSTPSEIQSI